MSRKPDTSLIGKVYNNLRVDKLTNRRNTYNRLLYECTCLLCGRKRDATKQNLQKGEIKDCGHHKEYNDIAGYKFGKLTALYPVERAKHTKATSKLWHCKCDCGNECNVNYSGLKSGKTKSCGCLQISKVKSLYVDGTAPCKLDGSRIRSTNTSGVTGVWYDKSKNLWSAEIMFKHKKYYLGRYAKKEDAINARKAAEEEIFGEFLEWYEENKQVMMEKNKHQED